jgi:guanylate kinase
MARRLATAREELEAQHDFDAVVVNAELESACTELVALLGTTAFGEAAPDLA